MMLDRIVSILPADQQAKAKAWVAWLGAVWAIVVLVVPVLPNWAAGIGAVLTALGVYKAPNVGYVRPNSAQLLAPFIGQTQAGRKTPGGLAIWGAILAGAGLVELWGVTNPGSFDTLSEWTRWAFNTDGDGAGPIVFGAGWVAFAAWFLWHILGGRASRKGSVHVSLRADTSGFTSGLEDAKRAIPGTVLPDAPLIPDEPLDGPLEDYDQPR